jgi:hypothetical protein
MLVGAAERYRHGDELHLHVQVRASLSDPNVRDVCALYQRPPRK